MSLQSDIRDHSDLLNKLLDSYGDRIEEYNAMVHAARSDAFIPPSELPGVLQSLFDEYNSTVFIGRDAVRLLDEFGRLWNQRASMIRDHNAARPKDHPLLTNADETPGWLEMIQDETYDVAGKFTLKDKERARSMIRQLDDLQKQREGKL